MSVRPKSTSQKGDTIVEVLMSIAVVSTVLAAAFGTMNRNLLLIRGAQEQAEASKYAQGQLESLKAYTDSQLVLPAGNFCMNAGSPVAISSGTPAATAAGDGNYGGYPAGCTLSFYHSGIIPINPRTYQIIVRWDLITGGKGEVVMFYKTYN